MHPVLKIFLGVLICAPCAAMAQGYGPRPYHRYEPYPGYVDAYYQPSVTQDFSDGSSGRADGDGFGFRAWIPVAPLVILTGEWQRDHYDTLHLDGVGKFHANVDDDQYRLGAGLQWHLPAPVRLAAYAEYINEQARGDVEGAAVDTKSDGFGFHGRATFSPSPWVSLYGQVGYVRLRDDNDNKADGPELLGGVAVYPTPLMRLFVDVRSPRLTDDQGGTLDTVEVRTGIGAVLGI